MNWELPDVQTGFRKSRGTRDQVANIWWIIEKAKNSRKHIEFCFINYAKTFDCVDHSKLWKILKDGNTRLPYLLSEKHVHRSRSNRTGHGTMDWFKIGKEVCQGCIQSSCLFNFYTEHIMWNSMLDQSQAELMIAQRNTNNLRYALVSLVAQTVKNLHPVEDTRVWYLGREDPLKKDMATHSSILAWEISWTW